MAKWIVGSLETRIAKDGKGKFDITIPEPFDFDRRDKRKEKGIREQKLEEDLR
jgi:hypothetical protein